MYANRIVRNVDEGLPTLLRDIDMGNVEESRGGRTKEITHVGVTITQPNEKEITLPDRKASIAAQIAETMWVLAGRDDVAWLRNYLPRADDFSDDGVKWRGAYGARLRGWKKRNGKTLQDQLYWVVKLLREDPSTRRAVMSIYDPDIDSREGYVDTPCNDFISFLARNRRLDMHVFVRSNDVMWGWSGINAFEWSSLLQVVAGLTNLNVGMLHFSVTSLHLYERHWERSKKIQENPAGRYSQSSGFNPLVAESNGIDFSEPIRALNHLIDEWFFIEELIRTGHTRNVTRYVEEFPEPMLKSWLRVLQWYWTGDDSYLLPLGVDNRLCVAAKVSANKPKRYIEDSSPAPYHYSVSEGSITKHTANFPEEPSEFLQYVTNLHAEKHEAYGDSWKRRGEMLGILANIARKVDRLGKNGAGESSADTAIDLMVYLAKYRLWLLENDDRDRLRTTAWEKNWEFPYTDHIGPVDSLLVLVENSIVVDNEITKKLEQWLTDKFDDLEDLSKEENPARSTLVDSMLDTAYTLARRLWEQEEGIGE